MLKEDDSFKRPYYVSPDAAGSYVRAMQPAVPGEGTILPPERGEHGRGMRSAFPGEGAVLPPERGEHCPGQGDQDANMRVAQMKKGKPFR